MNQDSGRIKNYQSAFENFFIPIAENMRKDLDAFSGTSEEFEAFTKNKYGLTVGIEDQKGTRMLNFSYEEAIHTFHSQNPDYDPTNNKAGSL